MAFNNLQQIVDLVRMRGFNNVQPIFSDVVPGQDNSFRALNNNRTAATAKYLGDLADLRTIQYANPLDEIIYGLNSYNRTPIDGAWNGPTNVRKVPISGKMKTVFDGFGRKMPAFNPLTGLLDAYAVSKVVDPDNSAVKLVENSVIRFIKDLPNTAKMFKPATNYVEKIEASFEPTDNGQKLNMNKLKEKFAGEHSFKQREAKAKATIAEAKAAQTIKELENNGNVSPMTGGNAAYQNGYSASGASYGGGGVGTAPVSPVAPVSPINPSNPIAGALVGGVTSAPQPGILDREAMMKQLQFTPQANPMPTHGALDWLLKPVSEYNGQIHISPITQLMQGLAAVDNPELATQIGTQTKMGVDKLMLDEKRRQEIADTNARNKLTIDAENVKSANQWTTEQFTQDMANKRQQLQSQTSLAMNAVNNDVQRQRILEQHKIASEKLSIAQKRVDPYIKAMTEADNNIIALNKQKLVKRNKVKQKEYDVSMKEALARRAYYQSLYDDAMNVAIPIDNTAPVVYDTSTQ